MSDNIKVVVKVRPLIGREIEEGGLKYWRVCKNTLHQLDSYGQETSSAFTFDKVYDTDTKTQEVYDDIAKPIVEAATNGINGTIFAYGQTSSGKTHTMMGDENSPGIISLAVYDIFDKIKEKTSRDFLLRVSYIEIYNETIKDLLDNTKSKIKVCETFDGSVKVDATERVTSTPEQVLDTMREGEINRQVGATNMNEKSSRSHTIFQITIESREHTEDSEETGCVNVSQLNLVDLAGSERAGQTGATGVRFREGTSINKSLSALGHVIMQLSEDPNKFINYRDSKLTRILQNSLGGNAKTSIICAVTPAAVEQTISTLQFANRAKAIKNKPEVNAVATNSTMLQSLTKKLANLQYELDSKKHLEDHNEQLLRKIKDLQKQILFGMTRPSDRVDRRKTWCAPRRATISALMPSIGEEDLMPPPKFCTPSINFGKRTQQSGSNWVMTPRTSDIPEANEEELVTPPLRRRNPRYTDEVITLDDSDDEKADDTHAPCSPYHKCYETSKTPPCILRDKAKIAELNYNDLIELTEREKIYSPKTVELMEHLDKKSTNLCSIKDELEKTKLLCEEKDKEINVLKEKICGYEDDNNKLSAIKINLESEIKNDETRITDLEVCLDNCKQKAKQREFELLSLLDEKSSHSLQDKSIVQEKATLCEISAFLNMSKDISLVSSDVETSASLDPEKRICNDDVKNLQAQINEKNNLIRELNKKLTNSQQSVKMYCEELETTNGNKINEESAILDLKNTITDLNEKLNTANDMLKSYENLVLELKDQIYTNESQVKEKLLNSNNDISLILRDLKKMLQTKTEKYNMEHSEALGNPNCPCECKDVIDDKIREIQKLKEQVLDIEQTCQLHEESIIDLNNRNSKLLEINEILSTDMRKLSDTMTVSSNEIKNLKQNIEKLRDLCTSKDNTIEELQLKQESLLSDIQNSEICKSEAVTKHENLQHELEIVLKKIEEVTTNTNSFEKLNIEMATLQLQLQQKDKKLEEVCENLQSATKEKEILQNNLQDVNSHLMKLQNETSDNKSIINNLNQQLLESRGLLDEMICQKDEISYNLKVLKTNLEETQEQVAQKELTIKEFMEHKQDLELRLLTVDAEVDKKCSEIKSLHDLVSLSQNENLQSKAEIKSLHENLNDKEKQLHELSSIIEELEKQVRNLNVFPQEMEKLKLSLQEKESSLAAVSDKIKVLCNDIINTDIKDDLEYNLEKLCDWIFTIKKQISDQADNNLIINKLKEDILKQMTLIKTLENEIHSHEEEVRNLRILGEEKSSEIVRLVNLYTNANNKLRNQNEYLDMVRLNIFQFSDDMITKFNHLNENVVYKLKKCDRSIFDMNSKIKTVVSDHVKHSLIVNENQKNNNKDHTPSSLAELSLKQLNINVIPHYKTYENRKSIFDSFSQVNSKLTSSCHIKYEVLVTDSTSQTDNDLSETEKSYIEEIGQLKLEKLQLISKINVLQDNNSELNSDNEYIKEDVNNLIALADELNKHISKHRTQFSTLTATMYAENKLLKSKLKALHHHHIRLHGFCQREMPGMRQQLSILRNLLQNESCETASSANFVTNEDDLTLVEQTKDNHDIASESLSKYSLATLGNETLMLGNNFTLGPSANSTMITLDEIPDVSKCENLDVTAIPSIHETNLQIDYLQNETKTGELKVEDVMFKCCDLEFKNVEYNNESNNLLHHELHKHSENCIIKKSFIALTDLLHMKERNIEDYVKDIETMQLEKINFKEKLKLISSLQDDLSNKALESKKLNQLIGELRITVFKLQAENESLSNDIMDLVTENDGLKEQFDKMTNQAATMQTCEECMKKDEMLSSLKYKNTLCENVLKESNKNNSVLSDEYLNRSLAKCYSQHDKFQTSERKIQAGHEDCKKLDEEVSTMRDQLLKTEELPKKVQENLSKSNLEIENVFNIYESKNMSVSKSATLNKSYDLKDYENEKRECINFISSKLSDDDTTDILCSDKPIIDIIKNFYNTIWTKHNNEQENILNRLKQIEEDKSNLRIDLNNLTKEYNNTEEKLKNEIELHNETNMKINRLRESIQSLEIHSNDNGTYENYLNSTCELFSLKLMEPLDHMFNMSSSEIFNKFVQAIQNHFQEHITISNKKFVEFNIQIENLKQEFATLSDKYNKLNLEHTDSKKEITILKEQKDRLSQICRGVTIDLVRKEENLKDLISQYAEEANVVDTSLPTVEVAALLLAGLKNKIHLLVNKDSSCAALQQAEIIKLENKVTIIQNELTEKQTECLKINTENQELMQRHKTMQRDIIIHNDVKEQLEKQITALTDELNCIKNELKLEKMEQIKQLHLECTKLQSVNAKLTDEKKDLILKLEHNIQVVNEHEKALEELRANFEQIKGTNNSLLHNLEDYKDKSNKLNEELIHTNRLLSDKCEELARLEKNTVTHQKTTEIQANMCKRLQKEKEELESSLEEKLVTIEQLTTKCTSLQSEVDDLRSLKTTLETQMVSLKAEGDVGPRSSRNSLDAVKTETRRRRQSAYDQYSTFADIDENISSGQEHPDKIFGSFAPTKELFSETKTGSQRNSMDESSKQDLRSGNSSVSHANKSDDGHVTTRRRRRQSIHDMHRLSSVQLMLASSKEDIREQADLVNQNKQLKEEVNKLKDDIERGLPQDYYKGECERLTSELDACRRQHSELQQRYRELDEECEICSQYLQERDQQCVKLGQLKGQLERELSDLKKRLGAGDAQANTSKTDAAVNTEVDLKKWHSAVVDRMSYDAEVDKRKKLAKSVEDLANKNRELTATINRLEQQISQSAGDKEHSRVQELRSELEGLRQQYSELQQRYRELDEECEMCSQNLQERDKQCVKLGRIKVELEAQIQQMQHSLKSANSVTQSTRKKRQSCHDDNREVVSRADAATNTDGGVVPALGVDRMTHDAEVERRRRLQAALDQLRLKHSDLASQLRQRNMQVNESTVDLVSAAARPPPPAPPPLPEQQLISRQDAEIKHLRQTLEEMQSRCQRLEQLGAAAPPAVAPLPPPPPPATVLVATGSAIVQNQMLSDFIKENQRLKKINANLVRLCKKRGKLDAEAGQENIRPQ